MTKEEIETLKMRADANNEPPVLYAYAQAIRATSPEESDKYMIFAAQLGQPEALEYVGNKHLASGNYRAAALCFKVGAKAGLLDCSVKLAAMNLAVNEAAALKELEDLAEIGVHSACVALAEYYRASGNKKQAAYWSSLIK